MKSKSKDTKVLKKVQFLPEKMKDAFISGVDIKNQEDQNLGILEAFKEMDDLDSENGVLRRKVHDK